MRITVVTPLFPTSAERFRGIYIYNTVRSLQKLAHVDVVCPSVRYPAVWFGWPRAMRSAPANPVDSPGNVNVRHIEFRGFPVVTRAINSRTCRSVIEPHIKKLDCTFR